MPDGWQLVALRDVFESSKERLGLYTVEPPVFALSKYDGLISADEYFGRRIASQRLDRYKLVHPGDWAYSTIHIDEGSIARNDHGFPGVLSPMYTTMRWRGSEHEPRYFEHLLRSPNLLAEYKSRAQGTVNRRRSLPFPSFASIEVQVPPLAEQRRIVDLISAMDHAIRLGRELGRSATTAWHAFAAEYWHRAVEEAALAQLGKAVTGATPSTTRTDYWVPAEIPFFAPGDFDGKPILTAAQRQISRTGAAAVRFVKAPAVAQVCIGATYGKAAVIGVDACTNQQINALVGLDDIDATVVMAMLATPEGLARLRGMAGTTTIPIVKKSLWADMRIRWPEARSRRQLHGLVTALAAVALHAGEYADRLGSLRSAVLRELLAGHRRLGASYDRFVAASAP